ncbi:MAG TPA: hypothetical protein VHE83_13135, partial [Mycobacteriales bacterium]|nr:hypothetical protein [Mycobacteriales bacterium]
MSQARLLVRAVTVRPAATTADRAHGRALLLGLRSRYVVPVTAIDEDADGWVVHYDAPATLPTLAERLAAGRGLSLAEAVRLAADVAWGLAAGAAAGLVHGRLDATQIALGEGPARVVGLGLDALDAAPPAGAGIAPEVRAGGPPTEAADLWSLGVLLRDLTGGADLPLKLADLLGRMLDPHPSRRPASARAVATRLVGMRIAAAHVDPGPRRPAAGAGEARPVPPSPPSPPINLPPAPRPSAATVLPGSPPPVPPVPVPPVP